MIHTAELNNYINSSEFPKLFLSWQFPMVSLNSLSSCFDVSRLTPDGISVELEITANMLGTEQCCCNLGWEALFKGKPLRMENCSPTLMLSPILSQTWSAADWEQDHVFSSWHDILGGVQMNQDWERRGNRSENERWKGCKSRVGIDLKGLNWGEVMKVFL